MDEVDFTVLAATSVFTDLSDKCPPAEACRDAIDRTARATIRMANSTGGFGQVVKPRQSNSRGSMSEHRDWAQRSDTASSKGGHRPPQPPSRSSQQFELPGITDAYANVSSGPHLPPIQAAPPGPYRMNSVPNLKSEADGFSVMRNVPGQPRSNGSAPEGVGSPDTSAIDPSLLPSPTAMRTPPGGPNQGMVSSPTTNMSGSAGGLNRGSAAAQLTSGTPGAQRMAAFLTQSQAPQQGPVGAHAFSPAAVNFSELQGIDFLQRMGASAGSGMNGMDESGNVDLGLGLGWEGLHHDFSDGQQYDLFDGFFFGGQQGGGGGMGGPNGAL